MPDEALINQIENMLAEVVELGGQNERSSIVPNLTVVNANPAGLTGYLIISDDRDGDNILAKKIGGITYNDNDLVNVMFLQGTEPIAFQQGSESPTPGGGGLWSQVPATSTDIYYDSGDVGIGKSVAPDAGLEILSTSQSQLRLTHTEDTVFVDFTLDSGDDLTITPSSNGSIILQPATDSTSFFQVLDADGGTPIFNIDATNERGGFGTATPATRLDIADGALQFSEMTAPSAGAANTARDYADDDGSGNTQRQIKFGNGDTVTIAREGGIGTYTLSNVTTTRTFDADSTTLAEVADVLGTLIADFQAVNVLADGTAVTGLDVIEANFHGAWLESYFTYGGPDAATSLDEVRFFDI